MNKTIFFFIFLLVIWIPSEAASSVIKADTSWSGDIALTEDILIPEGVTLTIAPGTTIKVTPSESSKMEPEYMSPLTEITVRGRLVVKGTKETPVLFSVIEGNGIGNWAGIIIDGGSVSLKSCIIQDAETGVYALRGVVIIEDSALRNNRYGLVAQGNETNASVKNTRIAENDYGLTSLSGARIESIDNVIKDNKKKDSYSFAGKDAGFSPSGYGTERNGIGKRYGDEVILKDTVWEGNIEINGVVRVPEGIRLIITPGTVIEFRKRDTDGDGIGENGFLIQGLFVAKGTAERPIVFRSAEKIKKMGDWDAINIMSSDGAQNLIEYCLIEDAYRALHFHFSNVAVNNVVLRNNYRGIQFQESLVEIKDSSFYGNMSGLRGRDSKLSFINNVVYGNYRGMDLLRDHLTAKGNKIMHNAIEGVKIREGSSTMEDNLVDGNRYGLMVTDSYYGNYYRNVITNNSEAGFSMKNMDNAAVSGNFISGNGINGLNLQNVTAEIRGNQISLNGERGIGIISFDGTLTENNFIRNGLYAVGLEGRADVAAPSNWWGADDIEKVIFDKKDDSSRGVVLYDKPAALPLPYTWPLQEALSDVTWHGDINVKKTVTSAKGATLTIAANTKVEFAEGSGLAIKGKIMAEGKKDSKITFTSLQKKGHSDWDEILLDSANGSVVAHCVFEHATWALHSHFTNLVVRDSIFRKNYGGIRFTSGPLEIKRSTFEDNSIGIRSYKGNALITENVITRNEIGIFVREKGGGLTIRKNNIFGNSEYNVRSGDFNDEDVDARENWWGPGNPVNSIFDGRIEPGIGKVSYEPYLNEPIKIGVKAAK